MSGMDGMDDQVGKVGKVGKVGMDDQVGKVGNVGDSSKQTDVTTPSTVHEGESGGVRSPRGDVSNQVNPSAAQARAHPQQAPAPGNQQTNANPAQGTTAQPVGNPADLVAQNALVQKTIELLGARVVSVHPRAKRGG